MPIVESFDQPDEVSGRGHENQEVEHLVRASPDIECTWHETFGNTSLEIRKEIRSIISVTDFTKILSLGGSVSQTKIHPVEEGRSFFRGGVGGGGRLKIFMDFWILGNGERGGHTA